MRRLLFLSSEEFAVYFYDLFVFGNEVHSVHHVYICVTFAIPKQGQNNFLMHVLTLLGKVFNTYVLDLTLSVKDRFF